MPATVDGERSANSMDDVCRPSYRGRMIVVAALLVVVAAISVVGLRRRHRVTRDDTLRVGDESSVDGHEAARRAQGRAAWTRFSGGF
ncbi:hypothetical protein [Aeromicrobium fastidiosum]|uniref:Uncharacterized protein n=1 Tax=Aeromicrobium fastidiosum TaxID=52699 RepID=A0A641AJE1_9ACTN|nr:hypothetical protein [Aeromicrobium fastidiosum]KAA1373768.1 hypothetical protein ESP62_017635 [Aeromicrobium fastidiosum]MBP2391340.1 hypothetical protein [Aeromicrobium fastidiosum]